MDIIEFAKAHNYTLTPVQRFALKAIYGLPLDGTAGFHVRTGWREKDPILEMTEVQYAAHLYREGRCNQAEFAPNEDTREVFLSAGRRGGKDHLIGLIATYEGYRHTQTESHSEMWNPWVLVLAPNLDMAQNTYNNVLDVIEGSETLAPYVANQRSDMVRLQTKQDIERHGPWVGSRRQAHASVHVGYRAALPNRLRGLDLHFAVLNEFAHFADASAEDVLQMILPPMARHAGRSFLLVVSSPSLEPHNTFRRAFENVRPPALSLMIPTWEMNPEVPSETLEQAYQMQGHQVFTAEYGGRFFDRPEIPIEAELNRRLHYLAEQASMPYETLVHCVLEGWVEGAWPELDNPVAIRERLGLSR